MSTEIKNVRIVVSGDSKSAEDAAAKTERSFTEMNQAVELAKTAFNSAKAVFGATFEILEQGNTLLNVERGFQAITQSTGATSVSLEGLQRATQGLVSSTDLLTQANQAMTLGLPGDELEQVFESSMRLAKAQGVDMKLAIESVVVGVGRQSRQMLDNLGIIVDTNAAYEAHAKTLGLSVDEMTEAERKAAFMAAAFEQLREKSLQVSEVQLNAADSAQQLVVAWDNQTDVLGVALAKNEDLNDILGDLAKSLEALNIPKMVDWFGLYAKAVVETSSKLAELVGVNWDLVESAKGVLSGAGGAFSELTEIYRANFDEVNYMREGTERASQSYLKIARVTKDYAAQFDILTEEVRRAKELFENLARINGENSTQALKAKGTYLGLKDVLTALYRESQQTGIGIEKLGSESDEAGRKTGELTKAQKKALEAEKKRREELFKLNIELTKLRNQGAFDDFMPGAGIFGGGDVLDDAMKDHRDAIKRNAKEMEDAQKEAYRRSVDFWESILIGSVEGNISDVLENMLTRAAVKFGAEMLAQMTGFSAASAFQGGIGGFGSLFGATSGAGGSAGLIPGVGGAAGAAGATGGLGLASILGPVAAGAAIFGPGIKEHGGNIFNGSGNTADWVHSAAIASGVFSPLSPIADVFGFDLGFGSGPDPDEGRRDAMRDRFDEMGLTDNRIFSLFGGGTGNIGDEGAINLGAGLDPLLGGAGALISILGSGDTHLAGNFANALAGAENLNAAMLTAQGLITGMGLNAETAGAQLLQAYAAGQIPLEELNQSMDVLNQLMVDDLPDLAASWELLGDAIDGPPQDAIRALQLNFRELEQVGVTTPADIVNSFESKFPGAGAAIQAAMDAGITSFESFNNLSNAQMQVLFNVVHQLSERMGGDFSALGEDGRAAFERILSSADASLATLTGTSSSQFDDIRADIQSTAEAVDPLAQAFDQLAGNVAANSGSSRSELASLRDEIYGVGEEAERTANRINLIKFSGGQGKGFSNDNIQRGAGA